MPASRPRSNASVDPEDDDEYQHQHQHQQSNEDENEHDDDGEDDSRELDPLEKKRREASSMRKLRSQLRDQYALTEQNRRDISTLTPGDLERTMRQQERLFNRITRPQEAMLDARAFITTSNSAAHKAREMKVDQNAFDTNEFLIRLGNHLGLKRGRAADDVDEDGFDDEADDDRRMVAFGTGGKKGWEHIGWLAAKHSRRVFVPDFLLGSLSVSQKARAKSKRARLDVDKSKAAVPENVAPKAAGEKSESDTATMITVIEDCLMSATEASDGAGSNFFEFVINPHSFSQTVENIFYLAFLIRDGKAGFVYLDDDDSLLGVMATEPGDENDIAGGLKKIQMVLEITTEIWKDAIATFGITESMWVPHREDVQLNPGQNQWY